MSANNGEFVTGTKTGDLRLFDKIRSSKAKNLYSFYVDTIKHIYNSSDDLYILITCDKYLLLINIINENGKKIGFHKNTLRLEIKSRDINK